MSNLKSYFVIKCPLKIKVGSFILKAKYCNKFDAN